MLRFFKAFMVSFTLLFSLSSCANYQLYTITEQEMVSYLQEHIELDKSILIPGLIESHISLSDMEVGIGRISADRIHLKAHASGSMRFMDEEAQSMTAIFSFSAIPSYKVKEGAVYLKELMLESIQIEPFSAGETGQKVAQMILPMLNLYLENEPVYQIDKDSLSHSFLNQIDPMLVIRDHQLVLSINNEI